MLEEPTKITPYQYESISPNMDEILTGLSLASRMSNEPVTGIMNGV
jgi:hypothetical protein